MGKEFRSAYRPQDGFSRNPLSSGNIRNGSCICGSQIKIKKCCGLFRYIRSDYAEAYSELKKGNYDMAQYLFDKIREKDLAEEKESSQESAGA